MIVNFAISQDLRKGSTKSHGRYHRNKRFQRNTYDEFLEGDQGITTNHQAGQFQSANDLGGYANEYPGSNGGENYPGSNGGGNYPGSNGGENYLGSNGGENYPGSNGGENYLGSSGGGNYPGSNGAGNVPGRETLINELVDQSHDIPSPKLGTSDTYRAQPEFVISEDNTQDTFELNNNNDINKIHIPTQGNGVDQGLSGIGNLLYAGRHISKEGDKLIEDVDGDHDTGTCLIIQIIQNYSHTRCSVDKRSFMSIHKTIINILLVTITAQLVSSFLAKFSTLKSNCCSVNVSLM